MRSAHRFVAVVTIVGGPLGFAAATASAQEAVYACASRSSGALRVVAAGNPCKAGEFPLTWSVIGPQGPEGPAGPAGPRGAQGDPGDDHVFGVATTGSLTSNVLNIPELGEITVECNGTGTARFELAANQQMEYARRERDSDGGSNGRKDVFLEDVTPAAPAGTIIWYWLVGQSNSSGWVVRIHMRPILSDLSGTAAVTVTRIG